jgi:hypothetical protein
MIFGIVSVGNTFRVSSIRIRFLLLRELGVSGIHFLLALLCTSRGIAAVDGLVQSVSRCIFDVHFTKSGTVMNTAGVHAIKSARAKLRGNSLDLGSVDGEIIRRKINGETSPTARPVVRFERIMGIVCSIADPELVPDETILRLFDDRSGEHSMFMSDFVDRGEQRGAVVEVVGDGKCVSISRGDYGSNAEFCRALFAALWKLNKGDSEKIADAIALLLRTYMGQTFFTYPNEQICAGGVNGVPLRTALPHGPANQKITINTYPPSRIDVSHTTDAAEAAMVSLAFGPRDIKGGVPGVVSAKFESATFSYGAAHNGGANGHGHVYIDRVELGGKLTFEDVYDDPIQQTLLMPEWQIDAASDGE